MRFLQSLITIVASVSAQQAFNQILNPGANSVIQAGGGVQSITWTNLTSGNVSVALFSGSNPVVTVAPLADSIANTGTFLWTPETWLPSGNDYTIGVTDLSGAAPVQYSPFFTVQLCSTCSSSTRSTTTSFAAQTVSVSGLEIGTRTDAAFPTQAASASSASGVLSSGVANTASASAISSGALPPASLPAGPAASGVSSASGASASASGSGGAAGAAPSSTTASGATFKQASAGLSVLFGAAVLLL